jgi:hypothetical protein
MIQNFKIYEKLVDECIKSDDPFMIIRGKGGGFSIYYSKKIKRWVCFIVGAVMSRGVVINIFDNISEASEYVEKHGTTDGETNIQFRYPIGWAKRGMLNYYLDPIFDLELPHKNNQLKKLLLLLL